MRTIKARNLDLSALVQPGDSVVVGQGCGEPTTLTELLAQQCSALDGVSVFLGMTLSNHFTVEVTKHLHLMSYGAVGVTRALAGAGKLSILPCHMSQLVSFLTSGGIACDVALIQVSGPDAMGQYSLGLSSDYTYAAAMAARVVIAELNPQVPVTRCAQYLSEKDIDVLVEATRSPLELPPANIGLVERSICHHAQTYIEDGATLQMGVGAVPEAMLASLGDRRGLGVHSGMLGDSMLDLIESGAVDNANKGRDDGINVCCTVLGTKRLFDFVNDNAAVRMHPLSYTHNFEVLASLSRFVSINSAIEVDLTGQINAEVAAGQYVGAIGGQVDYVRAAAASEGGCSIIALPSVAAGGRVSRVVSNLSGPVTTARSDVDVVITEHGAAELKGKTLMQRVQAMLDIADPAFRDQLEEASRGIAGLLH
ncbi:MAG: acetyl-CoA hydrolase/transferase C-terminal domain-containing protein [Pseudomonadota bacterium]